MSSVAIQKILQEIFILATGHAANAEGVAVLEGMSGPNGDYAPLLKLINDFMGGVSASQGTATAVSNVLFNGTGLRLADANAIAGQIDGGHMSWVEAFAICVNLTDSLGQTLNNRAEVAHEFNSNLAVAGKSAWFNGEAVNQAVKNLLQGIGDSSTSLSNGQKGFDALVANLKSNGIQSAVVDGYVRGATVFVDANNDGIMNANEWRTTTDAAGNYVLPANTAGGKIIASGGTDIMTGKAFQGVLTAPAGSTVVNPLTTLIQSLVESGRASSVDSATTMLRNALDLPSQINLLSYDPLAVLGNANASPAEQRAALSVQAKALQVANVISQAAAGLGASSAETTRLASGNAVIDALAAAIGNAGFFMVDLTNVTTLSTVIQAASLAIDRPLGSGQAAQLANIAASSNTAAANATNITHLAQTAVISQGAAVEAIRTNIAGGDLQGVVNQFSGDSLNTQINQAVPGVITQPGSTETPTEAPTEAPTPVPTSAPAPTPTPTFTVTYSSGTFAEAGANNGSISATSTITLAGGETFTGTTGQPLAGTVVTNVPDGLTAVVTKASATTATVSFTGNATSHADANDISNLTVTLGNTAFTGGSASAVTGATKSNLVIDFADPVVATFTVTVSNGELVYAGSATGAISIGGMTGAMAEFVRGGTPASEPTDLTGLTLIDVPTGAISFDSTVADALIANSTKFAPGVTVTVSAADAATLAGHGYVNATLGGAVTTFLHDTGDGAVSIAFADADTTISFAQKFSLSDEVTITGILDAAEVAALTAYTQATIGGAGVNLAAVDHAWLLTAAQVDAAVLAGVKFASTETVHITGIVPSDEGAAMTDYTTANIGGSSVVLHSTQNPNTWTHTASAVYTAATGGVTLGIMTDTVALTGQPTVAQLTAINAATPGFITADETTTLSGSGAALKVLTDALLGSFGDGISIGTMTGNVSDVAVTVTGTDATVAQLTAINAATSGLVTAASMTTLSGTVSALKAVTDEIGATGNKISIGTMTGDVSNVAITISNAPEELAATDFSAIGAATSGVVTVTNAVLIGGASAEVTAALVTPDTLVVAATADVGITDTGTQAETDAILAATTGVVTTWLLADSATYANFANGDKISTGLTFANHTNQAIPALSDSVLNWNFNATTHDLKIEIIDTGTGTTEVDYILTGIDSVTESGGVFTLAVTPTFTVSESNGAVTGFGGTATGDITIAWTGAVGSTTATFTREGVSTTTSGAVTAGIALGASNTLSASAASLAGITISGASGTVVLTDTSLAATVLTALDTAIAGTLDASAVMTISGTAAEIAAVAASGMTKASNYAASVAGTTNSVTDLNIIDANTSGVITATVTEGTAAAANVLTGTGNAYTIPLTAVTAAATTLTALDAKTTAAVDASLTTNISGTAAQIAAVISAAGITKPTNYTATVTGTTNSVMDLNAIDNAPGSGLITSTVTAGTAATLAGLTGTDNAYMVTVSAGSAAATDLTAIDAATQLGVDATAVTSITGTAAEVYAVAMEIDDGAIDAPDWSTSPTGSATVLQALAIDQSNGSGIVTAAVSGLVADLATLTSYGATNIYTVTATNQATGATLNPLVQTYNLGNFANTVTLGTAAGSLAMNIVGGSSTDVLTLGAGVYSGNWTAISGVTTITGDTSVAGVNSAGAIAATLTLPSTANAITMTAAQYAAFTIAATAGTSDTIALSNGLTGAAVLNANVEAFVLANATNSVTLGTAGQNVTGVAGNDTVAIGSLTATGTIALGAGTNHVTANISQDISAATITAVSGTADLTINGNGGFVISTEQYNLFSPTGITFSTLGGDTIQLTTAGTVTAISTVDAYVLKTTGTNITLNNAVQSVFVDSATASYATAAGHVITGAAAGNVIAFNLDASATLTPTLITLNSGTVAGDIGLLVAAATTAHDVIYGVSTTDGNTYVIETVSGTVGATDTTLIKLTGATTLAYQAIWSGSSYVVVNSDNADSIAGTAAADTISGGGGADTLAGAANADIFVYAAVADSAASVAANTTRTFDAISDLAAGANDQINIAAINATLAGGVAATGITVTTLTTDGASLNSTAIATFADLKTAVDVLGLTASATGVAGGATGLQAYIIDLTGNLGALGTGKYLLINNADVEMTASDVLIQLTGTSNTPGSSDFILAYV